MTTSKQRIMLFRLFTAACKKQRWAANDSIRHRLTVQALGEVKSWSALNNGDVDKLKALLNRYIDPDDFASRINLNDPTIKERDRLIVGIEKIADELGRSYIETVCGGKSGNVTGDWKNLSIRQLRQLHITLKNRLRARKTKEEECLCPF